MIKEALAKIVSGSDLAMAEAREVMREIMQGQASPAQIGAFLTALRMKGETADEIAGCAQAMRESAIEVKPKQGFYDYERKYTKGMTLYECPAPIGDALFKTIQDDAMKAYTVLGCEGFGRVDVRLGRDDMPYFLEVNTIPGMTETSLVPMAAKASGISFPELIDRITLLALKTAGVENPKFGG